MLDIKPRHNTISQELIDRYKKIDTSTIGHVTTEGYIHTLKAQTSFKKMAGRVTTVSLIENDGSILYQALVNSQAGDILVITMPQYMDYACWGELRTIAATIKGLSGIITDGCVTDLVALQDYSLPVFAKGTSSITTRKLNLGGSINHTITLENLVVQPNSLAIGDADGLFILSESQASALIDRIEDKQIEDQKKREELLALGARQQDLHLAS